MIPLTVDVVSALRAEGDFREALAALVDDARAQCDRRRRMVLAHPDLAQQLTAAPCKFATPEAWTGYIAPATYDVRGSEQARNESPYRAQLVAIVAAAEARNTQKGQAA